MPVTLRRSCAACAKAKHGCDLGTPRCTRCVRRGLSCQYANAPSTSLVISRHEPGATRVSGHVPDNAPLDLVPGAPCDPFESYPQIRLPRSVVQRLMNRFLSKIAFAYYPTDPNASSNPFVTSWWPRALSDPALFHVSLQTASLDEELIAQKGFPNSQILMADSISLLRNKVGVSSLAAQDETINAVVTLAAIEHGKGNVATSRAHIEGVKTMVKMRGGINVVMQANPLTARMVVWVAMLVTGQPQFPTQDDERTTHAGDGIAPIEQWNSASDILAAGSQLSGSFGINSLVELDPETANFHRHLSALLSPDCASTGLTSTEIHDLTCFAIHRLLSEPTVRQADTVGSSAVAETVRYGMAIYMFILHGHAYYSHAEILYSLVLELHSHLEQWATTASSSQDGTLTAWILSVGLVAAAATPEWDWFAQRAAAHHAIALLSWADIFKSLRLVLWHNSSYHERTVELAWEQALAAKGLSLRSG